jgi:hypothetical protein
MGPSRSRERLAARAVLLRQSQLSGRITDCLLRSRPASPPLKGLHGSRAVLLADRLNSSPIGPVRARARQYRLSWDEANPGSCGLQDGQHRHTPPEKEESASVGGNVLMMAGMRAEEVAQFIVSATEPGR